MILEFSEELLSIKKKLETIPSKHRLAFCAAISQRMLPVYNTYAKEESSAQPELFQIALDEIWQILAGKLLEIDKLKQLLESCDEAYPQIDDYSTSKWAIDAQGAGIVICYTLEYAIEQDIKCAGQTLTAAHNCIYEHLDALISENEDILGEELLKKGSELIDNHPLTIREMKKENEDFQRLKETKILDRKLLKWLYTSSCDEGKILLGLYHNIFPDLYSNQE